MVNSTRKIRVALATAAGVLDKRIVELPADTDDMIEARAIRRAVDSILADTPILRPGDAITVMELETAGAR